MALQPELDFGQALPEGKEWFSVRFLARWFGCSDSHVINLIESGELRDKVDLRGAGRTKTMWRVHRETLVAFLNRRKKL